MKYENFIKILKEVSEKLDSKSIEHEIPYTHFDKKEFNYINIIIPNSVDARNLSSLLGIYEVKENSETIVCKYKDFEFHFIKSDPQLFQFTFYYYCWMPLSNLLATTAGQMGLTYDRYGLRYKYDDGSILISLNLQNILDFFGLPFADYVKGFVTEEIIYSYFCMNSYFNPVFYTEENIRKYDKYYDLNIGYYNNFYNYIKMYVNFEDELEEPFVYYYIVDEFFPESNFLKKVYKQITKKELPEIGNIDEIRDKDDFDNVNIRDVLSRAITAEGKYRKQLEEKRTRRKEGFKGLLDDIRKNPKFIWE